MTPTYIFIASRAPLIRLPGTPKIQMQRFAFECGFFFFNSTNIWNSIFFLTALLSRKHYMCESVGVAKQAVM